MYSYWQLSVRHHVYLHYLRTTFCLIHSIDSSKCHNCCWCCRLNSSVGDSIGKPLLHDVNLHRHFFGELAKETPARHRIINLFHTSCLLEGRSRVAKTGGLLLFESVDGRGQETIRHFGRRLNALVDRFGQIIFEIGKKETS